MIVILIKDQFYSFMTQVCKLNDQSYFYLILTRYFFYPLIAMGTYIHVIGHCITAVGLLPLHKLLRVTRLLRSGFICKVNRVFCFIYLFSNNIGTHNIGGMYIMHYAV